MLIIGATITLDNALNCLFFHLFQLPSPETGYGKAHNENNIKYYQGTMCHESGSTSSFSEVNKNVNWKIVAVLLGNEYRFIWNYCRATDKQLIFLN